MLCCSSHSSLGNAAAVLLPFLFLLLYFYNACLLLSKLCLGVLHSRNQEVHAITHIMLMLKTWVLSALQPWDAWMDCAHFGGMVWNLLGGDIPRFEQAQFPEAIDGSCWMHTFAP